MEDIEKLSYTDFVSLIQEENRPSGGKNTIREILINTFINKDSKVLEVGCTNGFTSLEIARTIGCKVWGIDVNANSIENAYKRRDESIKSHVKFEVGNAYNLPFDDNMFDLVICGNATSFMNQKNKAIEEYKRVLKPWKYVAIVPIYYLGKVPKEVVKKTSEEINVDIKIMSKQDWIDIFKDSGFEVYYVRDFCFDYKTEDQIIHYVKESLNKPHLNELPKDIFDKIFKRWKNTMAVFNENLKYTGFSIMILRKRIEKEEIELFSYTATNKN